MLSLGQETRVTINGAAWIVGRIEIGVIEKFRDWVREQVGDPYADAERFLDKLPREDGLALLKEGKAVKEQLESFSLQCPLARRFLATESGIAHLFLFALELHHTTVTLADAFAVFMALGEAGAAKAIANGAGELPKNEVPPLPAGV